MSYAWPDLESSARGCYLQRARDSLQLTGFGPMGAPLGRVFRVSTVRSSPDRHQEKARVRKALLRACLSLSAVHGFASLGLREVSREAGIAPTSFYRHFADMRELGRALIEELAAPRLAAIALLAESAFGEGRDGTYVLIDQLQLAAKEDPELLRFVLSVRHGAIEDFRERLRHELADLALCTVRGARDHLSPVLVDAVAAVLLTCCEGDLDTGARVVVHDALKRMIPPAPEGASHE